MTRIRIDLISGLMAVLFAGVIFVLTRTMPEGPAGFPRLIASGFAVFGAILALKALFARTSEEAVAADLRISGLTLAVALLWIGLLIAAGHLGFVLPGALFMAAVSWLLLGRPTEWLPLARIAGFSVVVSGALILLFVTVLGVDPPGPFAN